MFNCHVFRHQVSGFSLLEVTIAVVILSIVAIPLLTGVSDQFNIQTGESQTAVTEDVKILTSSTVNLVEDVLARNIPVVETAITTVDATPASTTTTSRQSYTANGTTYFYEVTVKEMSHLMDTSGGLVDWRGNSVGTGSAVHVIPNGNSMYYLVLNVFEDGVTTTPLRTQAFYLPDTSCGPADAFCPTYSGSNPENYYNDISNRLGLAL